MAGLGCFTVGWFLIYFVWVGAWVLCLYLVSWSIVYDVCCVIGARWFVPKFD